MASGIEICEKAVLLDSAGGRVGEPHLHQANMSHDAALYGFRRKIFTIHYFCISIDIIGTICPAARTLPTLLLSSRALAAKKLSLGADTASVARNTATSSNAKRMSRRLSK